MQEDPQSGRTEPVDGVLEHEAGADDSSASQLETVQQAVRTADCLIRSGYLRTLDERVPMYVYTSVIVEQLEKYIYN